MLTKSIFPAIKRSRAAHSQPKFLDLIDVDGVSRKVHVIDMPGESPNSKTMVILGGAAQTLFSWLPHYKDLAKGRRLIIPEMRCQGKTELNPANATMKQLVSDFRNLMINLNIEKTDLVGFSYGGRVALGIAAHAPELLNKVSLTGVALKRNGLGNAIIESWKIAFNNSNMEEAAWSFVLNGYSTKFLNENGDRISTHVDMICKSNDVKKLAHLYSNTMEDSDSYSLPSCATKIAEMEIVRDIQILAAAEDRIASADGSRDLASILKTNPAMRIKYEEMSAGHLLPFEKPRAWRQAVLSFIDS